MNRESPPDRFSELLDEARQRAADDPQRRMQRAWWRFGQACDEAARALADLVLRIDPDHRFEPKTWRIGERSP